MYKISNQILAGLTDNEVSTLANGQDITVNTYNLKRISRLNKGIKTQISSEEFKNRYALPLTGYELAKFTYVGREGEKLVLKSDDETAYIKMTDYEAFPLDADVIIGNREYDFDTMTMEAVTMTRRLLEDILFEEKHIDRISMEEYSDQTAKNRI